MTNHGSTKAKLEKYIKARALIEKKSGQIMQAGLIISGNILMAKNLTDKEKIIISLIRLFSDEDGNCLATNEEFQKFCSPKSDSKRITNVLTNLVRKGMISRKVERAAHNAVVNRTVRLIHEFE